MDVRHTHGRDHAVDPAILGQGIRRSMPYGITKDHKPCPVLGLNGLAGRLFLATTAFIDLFAAVLRGLARRFDMVKEATWTTAEELVVLPGVRSPSCFMWYP